MTNKERFLAHEVFVFSGEIYKVENTPSGPFIGRRTFNGAYDYFCNLDSTTETSFSVFMIFFGTAVKATVDFESIRFISKEGGAQQ